MEITERLFEPLSDIFIEDNYKIKIYKYKDLSKFNSIDEALGPKGAFILFYEHRPNYGHWVAILKCNNKLEFFNSYGDKINPLPDDQLNNYSKSWRKQSNQLYKTLSMLFLKSKYKLEYNNYQFQSDLKEIQTCGRWCIYRILNKNLSIDEFAEEVITECENKNLFTDELVCLKIN